ncbi:hypothetical protein N7486_004016 [Penicillium sp. IBT 16267x]|nr:hypothetical protein N7486_004016 [Penicillium sp. IBT 16267x]
MDELQSSHHIISSSQKKKHLSRQASLLTSLRNQNEYPIHGPGPPARKLPKEFLPPYGYYVPESIFVPTISTRSLFPVNRFTRVQNPRELLICTEGASVPNEKHPDKPKAGCAFMVNETGGWCRFLLEDECPTGVKNVKTAQCASIRAAIAALQCRNWAAEGFERIIIATSDASVVEGITHLMRGWMRDDWCYQYSDVPVGNVDMWYCLMKTIHEAEKKGCTVYFWATNGSWNKKAKQHAYLVCKTEKARKAYEKISIPSLEHACQ